MSSSKVSQSKSSTDTLSQEELDIPNDVKKIPWIQQKTQEVAIRHGVDNVL